MWFIWSQCLIFWHHNLFFTRSPTLGIIFSRPLRTVVVPKPVILGILPSISLILTLQYISLTSALVSGNFLCGSYFFLICQCYIAIKTNPLVLMALTLVTNISNTAFLTTSLSTAILKLLKSAGKVFVLSISISSTSTLKLVKFNFAAKLDASTPCPVFNLLLLHN